jgi:hypothetical protein
VIVHGYQGRTSLTNATLTHVSLWVGFSLLWKCWNVYFYCYLFRIKPTLCYPLNGPSTDCVPYLRVTLPHVESKRLCHYFLLKRYSRSKMLCNIPIESKPIKQHVRNHESRQGTALENIIWTITTEDSSEVHTRITVHY